ncbi:MULTISPECIES: GNAT family N-acetyltransferase [Prochlorococcus]|uniref:GNAT family N-acetyltransferase n=1 Tax=Prochlorococcus TaxID=1218 RepID=UPI000533A1D1|nr:MULTISPECIES: GNAT family N-acetyltransferase [Prochlorococcus]KGG12544.1 hypothetical protein EV05_1756 [Prochlorococcus sp. MIT 0601]
MPSSNQFSIRPINKKDHNLLKIVYSQAIEDQKSSVYTPEQIQVWSDKVWLPNLFDRVFDLGHGWIILDSEKIVSFVVRHPLNRVALLYTLGSYSRKGHATRLLKQIETDATIEGHKRLFTEASLISYPLFLRLGWEVVSPESIKIAGVCFKRYRMQKLLIKS